MSGQGLDLSPERLSRLAQDALTLGLESRPKARDLLKGNTLQMGVLITTDQDMAHYNSTYRGKAGPTNVLSFPAAEPGQAYPTVQQDSILIGDLIFSQETVINQASQADIPPQAHFDHLLVHGCLHLLHYDHQDDDSAQEMQALETDTLKKWGWPCPYDRETEDYTAAPLRHPGPLLSPDLQACLNSTALPQTLH